MIVTFGDMPPVYAKPKEQQVTPYPAQRNLAFFNTLQIFQHEIEL